MTTKQHAKTFLYGLLSVVPSAGEYVDPKPAWPNAINYFYHAGSLLESGLIGAACYFAFTIGEIATNKENSTLKRTVAAGILGLLVGGAANACTETEWGAEHVGKYFYDEQFMHVDASDLAWGTTYAGLVAAGLTLVRSRYQKANAETLEKALPSPPVIANQQLPVATITRPTVEALTTLR